MTLERKTIISPIDFSEQSFIALSQTYNLARKTNCNIRLLHVIDQDFISHLTSGMFGNENYADQMRSDIQRRLDELSVKINKEENITTLHITHFMEEAVDADRVIVMEKGKKLLEGTPKEVFSKIDTLKNIGLDVPCMTELSNLLRSEGLDIRDDILTVDEMVMELCQL